MKDKTPTAKISGVDKQEPKRESHALPKTAGVEKKASGEDFPERLLGALGDVYARRSMEERIPAALGLLARETGIQTVLCGEWDKPSAVWRLRYGWHQGSPAKVEELKIDGPETNFTHEPGRLIPDTTWLGISPDHDVLRQFSARPVAAVLFEVSDHDRIGMILLLDPEPEKPTGRPAQLAELIAAVVAAELVRERLSVELGEIGKKFDNLVERANDGIVIVQERRMVYANRMLLSMVGYGVDDLIGQPFSDFVSEADRERMLDYYTRRIRGEDVSPIYEATLTRKDGSMLPVEINAGVIHYQGKPADLAIVRDISQRKAMEAELLKSKKLESVGILAGGIAHDFNNLLTAIMGNISIVLMNSDTDERDRRLLKEAQAVVMRAKNLTQQLLAFAKADSVEKKVMKLSNLIISTVEFALSGAEARVHFQISPDLWPARIDDVQIGQAIHNLVMNSRDLMTRGGEMHISAVNVIIGRKNKHALPAGSYVQIELKDHGPGMSPHHQERVFDPYFSTKDTTAEKGKGLGLAICHSIIKDHQGAIIVESELGIGTTFTILLPAVMEKAGLTDWQEGAVVSGSEKKKILLMDDEDMILAVAERMLIRLGYDVVTCRSGTEAIRLCEELLHSQHRFDAMILDITVRGGMGGMETLTRLRKMHPECRAIASSGYSDAATIKEHLAAGFSGVLTKPYTLQKLGEVLLDVLEH